MSARYEARHQQGLTVSGKYEWVLNDQGGDTRRRSDTGRIVSFTEAEARIIAFALNHVAQDHALVAVHHGVHITSRNVDIYDGPTDGVKP